MLEVSDCVPPAPTDNHHLTKPAFEISFCNEELGVEEKRQPRKMITELSLGPEAA